MRAATALVEVAARRAGFIEIFGAAVPDEIFVQGWATDLPAGRMRVLAAAEPPLMTEFLCATHERADLAGRGRGFIGLLRPAPVAELASLRWLFFRTGDGWRALDLYEQHRRIGSREIPGHVRGLLPAASGPPDVLAGLRNAAHRFGGRETVSELQMPVRIGIDLALRADGSGVFLSGWLLDPTERVRTVSLVSGRDSAVISADWTRIPRKDVEDAFSANPLFNGTLPSRTPSGFLAFAKFASEETNPPHLVLDFGGGFPPAYFPLTLTASPPRRAVTKLLASLDPTIGGCIERGGTPDRANAPRRQTHAAGKGARSRLRLRRDRQYHSGDCCRQRAGKRPRANARNSRHRPVGALPADRNRGAGRGIGPGLGEIERLCRFYGLRVRLVFADSVDDAFDAMEAGVAATEAGTIALLSAHVLPRSEGWLPRTSCRPSPIGRAAARLPDDPVRGRFRALGGNHAGRA